MSVTDKETQDLLRRIVLRPDRKEVGAALPDGKRVHGGTGSYWFDGSVTGGSDSGGSDSGAKDRNKNKGKDKDKDDIDKDKDKNPNDPPFDPKNPPRNGDNASGIGPFYDCNTGRCVNVRLNGMVPPPDGWQDACTPPDTGTVKYIYKVDGDIDGKKKAEAEYSSPAGVAGFLRSFFRTDAVESYGTYGYDKSGERVLDEYFKLLEEDGPELTGHGVGFVNHSVHYPGDKYNTSAVWKLGIKRVPCDETKSELCNTAWPQKKCSEIVATADGFAPACEEYDSHLPPQLKGGYTGFTLCDEDGNPVTVTKEDLDWRVEHPKYSAYINSDYKVQSVEMRNI